MDGGKSFGQNLTVAAVTAVDMVVNTEVIGLPDGGRLLTHRQMSRAVVRVCNAVIDPAQLDLVEHVLKIADNHHIPLDAHQVIGRVPSQLIHQGFVVGVDRYRRKRYLLTFLDALRIDYL